jgi:hypothetical protein
MRFFTSGFFVKHLSLGHSFKPLSVFANNFEFTKLFELKVDSAVSLTLLIQKNFLRQPPFFKLLPQRRRVVKFTLAWILFDCLFKEMRAFKNSKIYSAVSGTPLSFDSAVSITPLNFDSAVSMTPLSHGARSYTKIDFH